MQPSVTGLALIGRSFPSDAYQALTQAYVSGRAEKRMPRLQNAWRRPAEAVVLPQKFFH